MKRLIIIITTTIALGFASLASAEDVVVVTANTSAGTVTAKIIERIYLKRKTLWGGKDKIVPVNLLSSDPVRQIFTKNILKRSHRSLVEYWNGKHFSGVHPPIVLKSEEAVKRFLKEVPGSVGYIKAGSLEDGLTVIHTIKN